jgi:hypothetical protein
MNTLQLDYTWHNHEQGAPDLNIKQFARAMAPDARVHRRVSRTTGPLWDGFFGMFDGPKIVPTSYTSLQVDSSGFSAESVATRKFGRSRETNDKLRILGGSRQTTGALAYLAKLTAGTELTAPVLNVKNATSIITRHSVIRNDRVVTPIDVLGWTVTVSEDPEKSHDPFQAQENPTLPLYISGILAVKAEIPLLKLPMAVASQRTVLEYHVSKAASTEIYPVFGAKSDWHLSQAWEAAMNEQSPAAAAQTAMRELQ